MKYFALRNSVIEKVLRLLQCKQQWLGAAAVRFVRVCVGLKDEFYNRYLVRNNLLEPIVRRLLDLGDRYNLLGSSILEIFDFMAREPVGTTLLNYVAENFLSELERGASYCSTFQALRQSVDGAKGTLGHAPAGGAGAGRQMRVGMAGLSQGVGDAGARAAAGWARGAPAGARELDRCAWHAGLGGPSRGGYP